MTRPISIVAILTISATAALAQTAPSPPAEPLMPKTSAVPGQPSGHPSMERLMAGGSGAATQPASAAGTLNISVTAGSANGNLTANEPVTVELYHRGAPLKKMELKTDGLGKLTVPEIPLMPPVQALVSIKHAGLMQQAVSPELNVTNPTQTIELKVYETTEEPPAWSIAMQHMIVQWAQDGTGARITEMLSASNPADRAWLGNKVGDGHITFTVALPPNAEQLELGGSFDEDTSKIVDGKLVTASALFPGRSEFRLVYTVPAKKGALELPIAAPAAVGNLIVFLPADDTKVTATGLTGGTPVDMGEGAVRMYRAENLTPGVIANLSISGIKAAAPEELPAAASKFSARNVAMGGAFLLALAGAAMMLFKKPKLKKA